MADQEVVKHTKKIFSVWSGKNSFWHKVREFLLEIIIIVFAVSLSIYLHDRSEKKHQRHETEEFLLGLKTDLQLDMKEMEDDKKGFRMNSQAFSYIANRKMNDPINKDSLNEYFYWLINKMSLVSNSGRFEGFKSSGKIGTIENKELQNNIMDLYQENLPSLLVHTNAYNAKQQKLTDYIYENRKRTTDSTSNLKELLAGDIPYFICGDLVSVAPILKRYDSCISKMNAIVTAIDKEYHK